MAKYDDFGNGGGNGGNSRGYATTLKISPFTKMNGELDRIAQGSSDFGQSIGVIYENASLVDGILTKRTDKDQYKVFSWADAPVLMNEDLSTDDLPPIMTQSYGSGDPVDYEILAARLEGDDEEGYDDDAVIRNVGFELDDDEEVPEADGTGPIPLDLLFRDDNGDPDARFAVWESASNSGPNSCAKTTTSILTVGGKNNVVDGDSKFNWLTDGVTLRPELEGLEVTYAKIKRQSNQKNDDGEYNTFHHPAWQTADGNAVMPDNNDSPASEADDAEAEAAVPDGGEVAETDADDPVAEFVATCASLEIDTEPAILGLLEDMSDDDEYAITSDDVEDTDALVADVQAAVAN